MDSIRFQEFKDPRLHTYLKFLLRAEARLNEDDRSVQKFNRGSATTGVIAIDFDFCFLQFRMALEIICRGIMTLSNSLGVAFPRDLLDKQQNSETLVKALYKANPNFFPVCITSRKDSEGVVKLSVIDPQPLPYEVFERYCRNRFSSLLHSSRGRRHNSFETNFDEIQTDQLRIRSQFSFHIIRVITPKEVLFVRAKIGNDMCADFADPQKMSKLKVF